MEEWREIPGSNGRYFIDLSVPEGRCFSLYNKYGLRKEPYCIGNTPNRGYLYWHLTIEGKPVTHQAARWIAITYPELVQNEYFNGAEIDHIDTDTLNNHPFNLRWVDRSGQMNNPITKIHMSECQKGKHHTDESKKKMSEAHKGKVLPEETRKKLSEAHKCITPSKETREKISKSLSGRPGHKGSEKQRLSTIALNKAKSKPILQIDKNTGNVIAEYNSLTEAANVMTAKLGKKVYEANISFSALNPGKSSYGYYWKYK